MKLNMLINPSEKFVPIPQAFVENIYKMSKNELLISFYLCEEFHWNNWKDTYGIFSLKALAAVIDIDRDTVKNVLNSLQNLGLIKFQTSNAGTIIALNTIENKDLDLDILLKKEQKPRNPQPQKRTKTPQPPTTKKSKNPATNSEKPRNLIGKTPQPNRKNPATSQAETIENTSVSESPKNLLKSINKNLLKKGNSNPFLESLDLDKLSFESSVSEVSNFINKNKSEEKIQEIKTIPEQVKNVNDILKSMPKENLVNVKEKVTLSKISLCIERLKNIGFAKQEGVTEQQQIKRIQNFIDCHSPDRILQAFEVAKQRGKDNNPGYIRKCVQDPEFSTVSDDIPNELSEKINKESRFLAPISNLLNLPAGGNSQKGPILFSILPKILNLSEIKKSPMQYLEKKAIEIKNLNPKFFTDEVKQKRIDNLPNEIEKDGDSFKAIVTGIKNICSIEEFMNILSLAIDENKNNSRLKAYWNGDKDKIYNRVVNIINEYSGGVKMDVQELKKEVEIIPLQKKPIGTKIADLKSNPMVNYLLKNTELDITQGNVAEFLEYVALTGGNN